MTAIPAGIVEAPAGATLDAGKAQKVSYCIPNWLRDEQIQVNLKKVPGRIASDGALRAGKVAIVGFGPSLQQTWEGIRDCDVVISTSGAHKFLIDRGIVPNYHVEVDPRAHKIALLGPAHPSVTYLPCSACHPEYIDHLLSAEAPVRLWHVFQADDASMRLLPPGEWAVTGGPNVGLRAMVLARFMGYRDLHIFGMDGSAGPVMTNIASDQYSHAGFHPMAPKKYATTLYNGREFFTTPAMLECARQTWHELDQLVDVTAQFYGDGLIQEMAKDYKRKEGPQPDVQLAAANPVLITPAYAALNRQLHETNLAYGVGGGKHADVVKKLCAKIGTTSVLDYGCGKGYLAKALDFPIWEYDPAIPGKEAMPRPADLVVCTDVLEHIEPAHLVSVLNDLKRVVRKVGYFTIHMGPSMKVLADGRNAHLIQRPLAYWRHKLEIRFTVGSIMQKGPLLHVVVGPLPEKKKHGKPEAGRAEGQAGQDH